MKVAIIDFDDSFTFNIYSVLKKQRVDVHIIDHKLVEVDYLSKFSHIILGPGPGNILDYENYFPLIDILILNSLSNRVKLIGICLGHQLIHYRLGRQIVKLQEPVHGQSFTYQFPDSEYLIEELRSRFVDLQFYNSWGVVSSKLTFNFDLEIISESGHIIASFSKNISSYQFHCESVGTSCQTDLFRQLLV